MGKAVTQCLNVFAYLPQDPTYVSSTFIWQLETSKFLLIQGLWWLLFICVVTGTYVVLPTCRHTQIKINKWLNIKYIYDNIWYHYHHLLQLLNEICETHFPFKFCCILSHNNGNNKKNTWKSSLFYWEVNCKDKHRRNKFSMALFKYSLSKSIEYWPYEYNQAILTVVGRQSLLL